MRGKIILVCLLAAALGATGLRAAEKVLSGDEVMALFSGKTVDYTLVTRDRAVSAYYAEEGSMRGMSGGNKMSGSWSVSDKGELCIDYGKGLRCRHIIEEDGVYKKYKEKDGKKIHVVTYYKFTDGNPNNY
ncbi:MAG: DUF995 domain-containing protein [Gammaproteobacteria bacterium]|jgi:hypothetical protein|nr:DUF995 domain-containing protein [Gammaproteobacteria bacterium]